MRQVLRKEPYAIGERVRSILYPIVSGKVVAVKENTVNDITYRVYRIETSNHGFLWINEYYLVG